MISSANLEEPRPGDRREPRHPALIHYNGYGDRLLALPTVRALAELFPRRLSVVGGPGDESLFYSGLPLREFHEVEFRPISRTLGHEFDAAAVVRFLRGTDLLVSLNTWHNPAVDKVLDGLGDIESLGFDSRFTIPLGFAEGQHSFDIYFAAALHIEPALRLEDFASPPAMAPRLVELARQLRTSLPEGSRILCVHTETFPTKMWSPDGFRQVLDTFLARHRHYFAVVVDPKDFGLDRIDQGHRVLPLSGLSLQFALAIVQMADLFLGVDSCMLHLADLAGVPSLGIFGPTDPRRWGVRFAPHRHVVACGGMERLLVEEVSESLAALADALEDPSSSR